MQYEQLMEKSIKNQTSEIIIKNYLSNSFIGSALNPKDELGKYQIS